jgi:transglutaminase-like putative cysteine protease
MRRTVWPLVLGLVLAGAVGMFLRSWSIGYPLVPRITERTWTVRLALEWDAPTVAVDVALPRDTPEQTILDERLLSGPLEASIRSDPGERRHLRWVGSGARRAAYEADIGIRQRGPAPVIVPEDPTRWQRTDDVPADLLAALSRLVFGAPAADAPRRCVDLLGTPAALPASLADQLRLAEGGGRLADAHVLCWRVAGFPARVLQAIPLHPGLYRKTEPLAEVFVAGRWLLADPARQLFPITRRGRLTWTTDAAPLVASAGGAPVSWQIDLRQRPLTHWAEFAQQTASRASFLARWSLFSLPPHAQEVFRVLLLVPIGALIVAVLRNVVGLNTFGTFMPILIAIAFRQTELAAGLLLFFAVVLVGYGVRTGLDRFKLLLVPRLSVILTFVIGSLALLSLLAQRWDFQHVVGVGLLPMVILTMTIERFFVTAEESGPRAALRMAASTGGVAAITYAILSWEYLQLVFFTYPELMLAIAGGQIALGRYVGFRLSELVRFRRLVEPS